MHGMSNIKFANAQQAKDWQCTYNVTLWHFRMMFIPSQLPQTQRFYGDLMSIAKVKCTSLFTQTVQYFC